MAKWTGKIYVFRDDQGCDHISLTMPTNSGKATVRAYQVTGPFIPIGPQKAIIVKDGDKWIADLMLQGFCFTPAVVDC